MKAFEFPKIEIIEIFVDEIMGSNDEWNDENAGEWN